MILIHFSADGTVSLAFAEEDKDAKYLAFGKSTAGSDWSENICDGKLQRGKILRDTIKWTKNGGVSWYKNGFYYSRYNAPENETKAYTEKNSGQYVCYHKIGTAQSEDQIIYQDKNAPNQFVGCYVPDRSEYLVRWVRYGSARGGELYIRPVANIQAPWKLLYKSDENTFFPVFDDNGTLYGSSDDDAPNGKVVRVVDPLGAATFETVIPEGTSVIDGLSFGGGENVCNTSGRCTSPSRNLQLQWYITWYRKLAGERLCRGFWGYPEDKTLYYTFSSFTYPTTIFSYTPETNSFCCMAQSSSKI